ncbi:hypothetical protein PF006_g18111 [Phytophthora fragariae]|uniref:Uncharacterized protein n=1 Tax=Phytophthora fragariae TaxID=53985 RepID=A0A6A3SND1_9STRA|nr:hypothetical protein PF006_g18111 [Phytophthora fragariae]
MARATAETPRSAAHVLSWLRRCRREELPVERVLDSVRSVAGVVPLGGRVGGSDGATPPRNSALTLFEAGKDADAGEESTTEQLDEKLWDLLLSSCQLPSSGDQQKLRKALETLQDAKEAKRLNIERLRLKFFAARRDFFAVRIELLRAARNPQHPNCQAAEEIVDELLKEGLREALLDEMHGRQFYQPPRFTGVGAAERKALVDWELQFLEEEALLRELLLLTLVASREKATLEIAVKIAKTVHSWEVRLFEDVFTASTLALPVAQESARRLTQMQCRRLFLVQSQETKELEAMLQQTLVAAEKQHSFHYLNALLRSLIFGNDYADSDNVGRQPFLPLSLHAKTLWALPNVAASSGLCDGNVTKTQTQINPDSSSIYQHVVAAFLNEMLALLRYMENLEGAQQLHAMVKFVLPVLSNASVAQQTLGIDVEDSNMTDIVASGETIDDRMDGESAWSRAHLHLVTTSFIALRTLLATPAGVDLLMSSSIGGGQEECVNLIVKSAKKLFELQERITGEYPVVLATQVIFMSVVRWFLAEEAETLANPTPSETEGYRAFVATERLWLVGAAEFGIEVLSTHESWKFISSCDRCEIAERCFRLLYVLVLPRKHVDERNDMISAFQVALHETLSTDMSLVMKLLRSSCAVLSSMEGHMGNWNSIAMTDNDEDDNASKGDCDGHFPLVYETEIDCAGVNLVRLESLVTTSLRFLALLVGKGTAFVNAQVARKIMLTPIDDGVPKKRKSLTIVTLCGGYLGYPVEKAPGIAYWSLQILQQAAIVLDYRLERESRDFSSMHSLVALFHGYQDLPLVRGMFSRLLRVSSPRHVALRKEVIEMLTLCLDHQPGFLALLLFGDDRKDDATANNAADAKTEEDPLPFVTLLERFFGASEQLLEQSSDLFCALLTFLVQVWEGAIHNGLGVHLKIMAARNVDC